tara:strand:+ start:12391 stop:12990 length:600 start_codon:yes stop_codon:yes gene_type:complete
MRLTEREKFIAIVDNDTISIVDAIVLLEGDGFNRYNKAADLYKQGWSKKIIFSGGITNYSYGSFPFSDILPRLLAAGIPKEDIIHEKKSKHTKEQAQEIIKMAIKNKWNNLILVATHDHQYRAYLSFLKAVLESKSKILLFNCPVRNLNWYEENVWGRRIDNIEIEFEKIEKYINSNQIATYSEAITYQEHKEKYARYL